MKKLMIAAAIVCAAAFAQAAATTWTWATGANAMGPGNWGNLAAGHVDSGATAMKDMTGVTWTYVMALSNELGASDELSGDIGWSMKKISVKNLSSDVMWKPATATDDPNVVDYSIVITGTYTDANKVTWTFTSDAISPDEPLKFGSTTTLGITSAGPTGWTVTSSAVPEPTSGLLLLLGVAGLALRRRRA